MKKILLGVVAGLMVASCSKNETVSLNQDEIQFSVVTNKAAKAADLYCNNNLPGAFKVSANYTKTGATTSATYIGGDNIEQQADGTWKNTTSTRYWPEEGTLDFYAHVNAGGKFTLVDDNKNLLETPKIVDFTVETDVTKQVDLLYATASGLEKAKTSNVALNFRHALSQIVFKAKNWNEHLYVVIEGVSVHNVGDKNTFTFPEGSTDGNILDHNQDGKDEEGNAISIKTQGEWAELTGGTAYYSVEFEEGVELIPNPQAIAVDLTGKNSDKAKTDEATNFVVDKNTMLLLPQTTTAWDPTVAGRNTGSYLTVKCKIYNIANPDQKDEKGGYVEGDVELFAGEASMPVAFTWEQGKKYIYTFVFGDGNGGYDEEDKPVLTPITFTVTVDDFTYASEQEVEMKEFEKAQGTTGNN